MCFQRSNNRSMMPSGQGIYDNSSVKGVFTCIHMYPISSVYTYFLIQPTPPTPFPTFAPPTPIPTSAPPIPSLSNCTGSANDYEAFPRRNGLDSDMYGTTGGPQENIYDNGMGGRKMKNSDDGIYDNGMGKS